MDAETIHFGLSYGLLEEKDGKCAISGGLSKSLIEETRLSAPMLRDQEIREVWDHVLGMAAFGAVTSDRVPEAGFLAFLKQIGTPLTARLIELGDRARVTVTLEDDRVDIDAELKTAICFHIAKAEDQTNPGAAQLHLFEWLSFQVRERFERHSPAETEYFQLMALFVMNMLNASGVLRDLVALVCEVRDGKTSSLPGSEEEEDSESLPN